MHRRSTESANCHLWVSMGPASPSRLVHFPGESTHSCHIVSINLSDWSAVLHDCTWATDTVAWLFSPLEYSEMVSYIIVCGYDIVAWLFSPLECSKHLKHTAGSSSFHSHFFSSTVAVVLGGGYFCCLVIRLKHEFFGYIYEFYKPRSAKG